MDSSILMVALGGAAGSVLRYLCQKALNTTFPYGTLAVNITGCLLIGLLWGYFARQPNEARKLLLVSGFCGGFTTYSAFTQESIGMLIENRWLSFGLYLAASIVAGLAATYFGYKISS